MPMISDFGFTMRPSRRDLVIVAAGDASLRGDLVTALQEDGYSVVQAASAEEAAMTLKITHASVIVSAFKDNSALAGTGLPIVTALTVDDIVERVAQALRG